MKKPQQDVQYLDRICKPFQQLHGKSPPYLETGLELAIFRRILEHRGGSITAHSKPGQGTCFVVRPAKWDSRQKEIP